MGEQNKGTGEIGWGAGEGGLVVGGVWGAEIGEWGADESQDSHTGPSKKSRWQTPS